jgi:hypothetical protein
VDGSWLSWWRTSDRPRESAGLRPPPVVGAPSTVSVKALSNSRPGALAKVECFWVSGQTGKYTVSAVFFVRTRMRLGRTRSRWSVATSETRRAVLFSNKTIVRALRRSLGVRPIPIKGRNVAREFTRSVWNDLGRLHVLALLVRFAGLCPSISAPHRTRRIAAGFPIGLHCGSLGATLADDPERCAITAPNFATSRHRRCRKHDCHTVQAPTGTNRARAATSVRGYH